MSVSRERRNYERATAWNKEKSRKGKKEIKERLPCALPASRPWYPLRFINFSQRQCQSHGVFRLQGLLGTRGTSLTVWYLNSKTRASQPTPFLSFLIVLVSLAAFPNVFPSFLILPSKRTTATPAHFLSPFPPPLPLAPACPPTVPPFSHPPQPPRSTKAQSIKYSKKPARIRAVLLSLSPPTAIRQPSSSPFSLLAGNPLRPCYFFVPGPPRATPP